MQYRIDPKSGNSLSILGFGCMRLPRSLNTRIDIGKTEKLIMDAIDKGVNYFDSAYIYPGSEQALGEVFRRNPDARSSIYLATKLPHSQCRTYEDFDKFFNTQLQRLGTDHIDYYLIHNMGTLASWNRLRQLGIEEWLAKTKETGLIQQLGFSFHGIHSEFIGILEDYDWDFCQIQYNYMNENYQAGRKGLLAAHEKGMSVIIMEPLLGGKLAVGLPKKAEKLFKDSDSDASPAAWALRWIWNQKEVTLLLSGMNSEEQLADNVKTAQTALPGMMSDKESAVINQAVKIFEEDYKVPCTSCNYCLPCPSKVNIPGCFAAYNMSYASGYIAGISNYLTGTSTDPEKYSGPRNCIKCGQCEKQCPQNIAIIESLEKVKKRMEPFWMRAVTSIVRKVMH